MQYHANGVHVYLTDVTHGSSGRAQHRLEKMHKSVNKTRKAADTAASFIRKPSSNISSARNFFD
jgi:hypothetical protein